MQYKLVKKWIRLRSLQFKNYRVVSLLLPFLQTFVEITLILQWILQTLQIEETFLFNPMFTLVLYYKIKKKGGGGNICPSSLLLPTSY